MFANLGHWDLGYSTARALSKHCAFRAGSLRFRKAPASSPASAVAAKTT